MTKGRWLATLAAIVSTGLATSAVGADNDAAWLKDRQARFVAYQAAHPNPDAEIADIKAKTAAMIAAYVPPTAVPKYMDLYARSAALTQAQHTQANQLFSASLTLWKAGDFPVALEGFTEGLAIDPGNGIANFYVGDILRRQEKLDEAVAYLDKAATLAPGSAEGLKAKVALRSLPPPEDPALDIAPVIWRVASAPLELWDAADAPEMIVVPAGEYTMGSPLTETGRQANEGPRHRVRIGYSFAISKYPITVSEFAKFVAETHYDAGNACFTFEPPEMDNRKGRNWRSVGFMQTNSNPVVCLNYDDAQAYANWVSRKTGRAYRLATEAEYEYANRAGSTGTYWWGNDSSAACAYTDSVQANPKAINPNWTASFCRDIRSIVTSPVGSFKPNSFGLYDTTGNGFSWVLDCWRDSYDGAPNDGSAISSASCSKRTLRGGERDASPSDLRSAVRASFSPEQRLDFSSIRLVRTF